MTILSPLREFVPFELERWQSRWEHEVAHNLSESGVDPLTAAELCELAGVDMGRFAGIPLGYSQTNGTERLRAAVAAKYPGATPDNVLITVGSSEANFISLWTLIEPGDRVAMQLPAYEQAWGLVHNLGGSVVPFFLHMGTTWRLDSAEVDAAIAGDTKLIFATDPNNPTGHVLTPSERSLLVQRAERSGAWLMVDEVYRGAERDGRTAPSFWGTTERVVVTGGLSKAYGLPGLRIGWVVAPAGLIDAAVQRHDYTVIGPAALSDAMAVHALGVEDALLRRSRRIVNDNYRILDDWLRGFPGLFTWVPPEAGAICLARYPTGAAAVDLVETLRRDYDVLLVPGEHFHLERHFRFGYGGREDELRAGLAAVGRGLRDLFTD